MKNINKLLDKMKNKKYLLLDKLVGLEVGVVWDADNKVGVGLIDAEWDMEPKLTLGCVVSYCKQNIILIGT